MKKLVETIVKPLVDYPEDVKVTQELYNGEIKYRLTVHPEDVGKVIGKQGKVAKAIECSCIQWDITIVKSNTGNSINVKGRELFLSLFNI